MLSGRYAPKKSKDPDTVSTSHSGLAATVHGSEPEAVECPHAEENTERGTMGPGTEVCSIMLILITRILILVSSVMMMNQGM